jgi:hypothetical protein
MGGFITLAQRDSAGEITACRTWTNGIPDLFRDERIWTDPEVLFTEEFENIRQLSKRPDSLYHKVWDSVYPDEYGLIFVDFQSRQILDCQHYTPLGAIHFSSLMAGEEVREDFSRLMAMGRLQSIRYSSPITAEALFGAAKPAPDQVQTWLASLDDLDHAGRMHWMRLSFRFGFQPAWTHLSWPRFAGWELQPDNMKALQDALEGLDIPVDQPRWANYIENMRIQASQ